MYFAPQQFQYGKLEFLCFYNCRLGIPEIKWLLSKCFNAIQLFSYTNNYKIYCASECVLNASIKCLFS